MTICGGSPGTKLANIGSRGSLHALENDNSGSAALCPQLNTDRSDLLEVSTLLTDFYHNKRVAQKKSSDFPHIGLDKENIQTRQKQNKNSFYKPVLNSQTCALHGTLDTALPRCRVLQVAAIIVQQQRLEMMEAKIGWSGGDMICCGYFLIIYIITCVFICYKSW